MKKILFLHGFYASGQCVPAIALKEALKDKVQVLTPDLPMHPKEAVNYIRDLIDREKPDAFNQRLQSKGSIKGTDLIEKSAFAQ